MNSVLSAFKSTKSDGNGSSGGKSKKSISPDNNNSYANLRHIREICSSSKMSTFGDDSDSDLRIGKCSMQSPTSAMSNGIEILQSATSSTATLTSSTAAITSNTKNDLNSASGDDVDDHAIEKVKPLSVTNVVDHMRDCEKSVVSSSSEIQNNNSHVTSQMSTNSLLLNASAIKSRPPRLNASSASSMREKSKENKENRQIVDLAKSTTMDLCHCENNEFTNKLITNADGNIVNKDLSGNCIQQQNSSNDDKPHTPVLSVASNRKDSKTSETTSTLPNKNGNRIHKRLSLTIGNNTLPSVHGQTIPRGSTNGGANETKRTRTSTHQRNLSLDFR